MGSKKTKPGGLMMSSRVYRSAFTCTVLDYPLQRWKITKKEEGITIVNESGQVFLVPYRNMRTFIIAVAEALCAFHDDFKGKNWRIMVNIDPE